MPETIILKSRKTKAMEMATSIKMFMSVFGW
jgi:hypothetical protein